METCDNGSPPNFPWSKGGLSIPQFTLRNTPPYLLIHITRSKRSYHQVLEPMSGNPERKSTTSSARHRTTVRNFKRSHHAALPAAEQRRRKKDDMLKNLESINPKIVSARLISLWTTLVTRHDWGDENFAELKKRKDEIISAFKAEQCWVEHVMKLKCTKPGCLWQHIHPRQEHEQKTQSARASQPEPRKRSRSLSPAQQRTSRRQRSRSPKRGHRSDRRQASRRSASPATRRRRRSRSPHAHRTDTPSRDKRPLSRSASSERKRLKSMEDAQANADPLRGSEATPGGDSSPTRLRNLRELQRQRDECAREDAASALRDKRRREAKDAEQARLQKEYDDRKTQVKSESPKTPPSPESPIFSADSEAEGKKF